MRRFLHIAVLLFLCALSVSAQDTRKQESRKARLEKEIAEINRQLRENSKAGSRALTDLTLVRRKITARQAMAKLDLKPNTFYRRIKEREDGKMTDMKKAGHEIREEIREAAKQSRRDLDELKKQVRAEAKEVKKAADEKLELHDVERELRKDRIRAEIEYHDSVKQLKKEVEAEAKELRKLNEE